MESNQVHVFAAAVSCDLQQIIHTVKSRFAGQIERDIGDGYLRDRVHDDVALFHPVPATNLHVGTRPDANAASGSSIPNAVAEVLTEHHMETIQVATGRRRRWPRLCYGGIGRRRSTLQRLYWACAFAKPAGVVDMRGCRLRLHDDASERGALSFSNNRGRKPVEIRDKDFRRPCRRQRHRRCSIHSRGKEAEREGSL
jgi:hypothetical protein